MRNWSSRLEQGYSCQDWTSGILAKQKSTCPGICHPSNLPRTNKHWPQTRKCVCFASQWAWKKYETTYVYGSYMGEALEPYPPKQLVRRCFVCSLVHTPSVGTAWQLFTWGSNTTTLAKAKGSGQVSGGMSTRLTNSSLINFRSDWCVNPLKKVILVQVGFRFFQVCSCRSDYVQ